MTYDITSVAAPTPGDWEIFPHSQTKPRTVTGPNEHFDYLAITIASCAGKVIGEASAWTAGESGGWPKVDDWAECLANARLMIAAPKLLAACEQALSLLTLLRPNCDATREAECECSQHALRHAIAKAKGGDAYRAEEGTEAVRAYRRAGGGLLMRILARLRHA